MVANAFVVVVFGVANVFVVVVDVEIFPSFVVRPNQLEDGGSVRLKCTASVMDLYWRSSEVPP